MPPHWTDFPDRVETFGDLFAILETFAYDLGNDLIDSGSCRKESDQSAYSVDLMGQGRFIPNPDRLSGWDALATIAEREFHRVPDLQTLRAIRGRASEILDVSISAVNGMTIVAVLEALVAADRAPVPSDDPLNEFLWLKVTQVEALFGISRGQVSKLADAVTFVTNGKTGNDRRINVLSVVRWSLNRLATSADTSDA